jgi:hypothetical protein
LAEMLLIMVGLLAIMALAMGVPDVPSGTSHLELYQITATSASLDNSQECDQADHSDASNQTHQSKHHRKCCHTATCPVFAIITSQLQLTGPEIVRTFFAWYWPPLSPPDPRAFHRPPKRLA